MTVRRRAIYPADVRQLGGIVTVTTGRDRVDGSTCFHVHHVSRGGDVAFQSRPIADEQSAGAAAQVLAEFVGAGVRL